MGPQIMRIAYYTHYIGPTLYDLHFKSQKYSFAAQIKSQGIARALMLAGHEVVIYSVAIPVGNTIIEGFTETENFPEGQLTIKYPRLRLYPKNGIINDFFLRKIMKKDHRDNPYDVFVYYNIDYSKLIHLSIFKNTIRILEYEDNVFNKYLEGGKSKSRVLSQLYNKYVLNRTDGAFAVSKGILNDQEVKDRIIIPGVINDEVIASISPKVHSLALDRPVKLVIMGGTGWDKGTDVLLQALYYVKTPCHLEMYSNINLYDSIRSLFESMPNRHIVEFKGFLPHKKLIERIDSDADILLCTTRSLGVRPHAAGFPSKILDYSATGRPIVSSELAQLDDQFNSCITYYEGDSPESLANKIEEVIANYDFKVQKALELQKLVLERYTIEGTSKMIQSLLFELNKSRP